MGIIKNYVAPAKAAPYQAEIDALIDAGEGAAFELSANTQPAPGTRGSIATEKVKFQTTARAAGVTAKVAESEDMPDGTTRVVFVLVPKRAHVRKPKDAPKAEKTAKA